MVRLFAKRLLATSALLSLLNPQPSQAAEIDDPNGQKYVAALVQASIDPAVKDQVTEEEVREVLFLNQPGLAQFQEIYGGTVEAVLKCGLLTSAFNRGYTDLRDNLNNDMKTLQFPILPIIWPLTLAGKTVTEIMIINGNEYSIQPCALRLLGSLAPLNSLRSLVYSFTPLSGELPPEIGLLTQLKELTFNNVNFQSVSPEIGKLVGLEQLAINSTETIDWLPEVAKLTLLRRLGVSSPDLTALPDQLSMLTSLEMLRLDNNPNLTTLPTWFPQLTRLQTLTLASTPITTVPLPKGTQEIQFNPPAAGDRTFQFPQPK